MKIVIRADRTAGELAVLIKSTDMADISVASPDYTMEELLVDWGFFPSLTAARKTKWCGPIEEKDQSLVFGKNKIVFKFYWSKP